MFGREPVIHHEPARAGRAADRSEQRIVDRAQLGDEAAAVEIEDDTAPACDARRLHPPGAAPRRPRPAPTLRRIRGARSGARRASTSARTRSGVGSRAMHGARHVQYPLDRPALQSLAHGGILPAAAPPMRYWRDGTHIRSPQARDVRPLEPHGEAVRANRQGHHDRREVRRLDPANNPTLRRVIQNARAINMPKDRVEAAIKRASGQGAADYQQVHVRGLRAARHRGAGRDRDRQSDAHGRERASHLRQARRQSREQRQRQFPVPAHGRVPPRSRRHRRRTSSSST